MTIKRGLLSVGDALSRPRSPAYLFLIFLAIDFPCQYGFFYLPLMESFYVAFIDAMLYTAILWATTRMDLVRVTLCFLALPYLIFVPGWLNLPTVIIFMAIFIFCINRALQTTTVLSNQSITARDFFAFLLILVWVNLSGIGGYGYETPDYIIHSARLKDLIDYSWPVRYGENKNFVFYMGYFLPSALIGKFSNVDFAFRSMYPWTILGVTLALRWLGVLSQWRFSAALVFIFIFFGPLDIVNVSVLDYQSAMPFGSAVAKMLINTDYLDFRTRYDLGFFVGNYLSNTFQLFWSPHQVIAGWLVISLMTYLFLEKQTTKLVFIYALLCLWSPLIMIALSPFVVIAVSSRMFSYWRDVITLENTLGAAVLIAVFVIFYFGGSASANPTFWIYEAFDWHSKLWILLLFYISAWGMYVAVIAPFTNQDQDKLNKIWFICLITTLLLLPLKIYGTYSDLLCRGSAPLMFLLLIYILRALKNYWFQRRYGMLVSLLCLLTLGAGSSILNLQKAIVRYGENNNIGSMINYVYASENLGPDESLFNKLFRKSPQEASH